MNWVRANKALAVFFAIVVVGVAVLAYLLLNAKGTFAETADEYDQKATELNRLQALKPFPDEESLSAEKAQRDQYEARIAALQTKLASMEFPLVPLTTEQFQDELRKSVSEIAKKAEVSKTILPGDFYLGFQQYRDALPSGAASGPLGRQLEAVKYLVSVLLDNRVESIVSLDRTPLPEEQGKAPSNTSEDREGREERGGREGREGGEGREGRGKGALVQRFPIGVAFTANPTSVRRILNAISSAQQQFLIVKLLAVSNEEQTGPLRAVEPVAGQEFPQGGQTEEDSPTADAQSGEPAKPDRINLVLGDEKLTVRMVVEMVDFANPEGEKKKEAKSE